MREKPYNYTLQEIKCEVKRSFFEQSMKMKKFDQLMLQNRLDCPMCSREK